MATFYFAPLYIAVADCSFPSLAGRVYIFRMTRRRLVELAPVVDCYYPSNYYPA